MIVNKEGAFLHGNAPSFFYYRIKGNTYKTFTLKVSQTSDPNAGIVPPVTPPSGGGSTGGSSGLCRHGRPGYRQGSPVVRGARADEAPPERQICPGQQHPGLSGAERLPQAGRIKPLRFFRQNHCGAPPYRTHLADLR